MSVTNKQISKVYLGTQKIYSTGSIVNYVVDTSTIYSEEREEGQNALSPTTFTPSKSEWTFAGWREDTTANGSVLSSKTVGDSTITLYAVFRNTVTVTYYDNSTTEKTTSGYRYYNNGNIVNPSFTLTQTDDPNWTERGWSTTNAGNASIAYANGATFTRDSNITLYGLYSQNIRLTTVANGSTTNTDKTRYWAPAGYINPTFTVSNPSKSGATFKGWSTSASSTTVSNTSISNLSLSSSTTRYAVFTYSNSSIARKFHNKSDAFFPGDGWAIPNGYMTLVSSVDFSKYSGITIAFDSVGLTQNWTTYTVCLVAECGGASVDLYSSYLEYTGTIYNSATSGSKTLNFTKSSGSAVCRIGFRGDGHCSGGSFGASGTLLGRTVVG